MRLLYGRNPLSAGGNENIEFVGLFRLESSSYLRGLSFQLARLRLKVLDFGPVTAFYRFVSSHVLIRELGVGFYKRVYFRGAEGRYTLGQRTVGRR